MNNIRCVFFVILLITGCKSVIKQKTCHLSGMVKGRDSKAILLGKQTDNPSSFDIEIPIDSKGHFYYDLKYENLEAYELIFKEEQEKLYNKYKHNGFEIITFANIIQKLAV